MRIRRLSPWHVERMNIDSFGKMADVSIGPFAPGMNVVFGKNESGKTTLSSFISGVLFGWPDGRSRQNTYKPENAERSGRLVFRSDDGGTAVLARTRNADGVEDEEGLLDDIDAATYGTMFALDSDELLSLDDTSAVTSRLLTAGAGTAASPVRALQDIDARIASYTSRSAAAEHSLVNLNARLSELDAQIAQAQREAASLIAESREHQELGPKRAELAREHEELNALIEGRSADLSLLQKLENQLGELQEQREDLEQQLAAIDADEQRIAQMGEAVSDDMAALRDLSASGERAIRDTLDDFQAERDRLMNAVDYAKRNLADSKAAYEVLEESLGSDDTAARRTKAASQAALSIILPVVALIAGVPTVVYGSSIASLTITAFGVILVVAALIMGAAAIVMALRPGHAGPSLEQRLEDARWVMLQDQKRLDSCEAELTEIGERIASYCHFNHLSEAGRSLRRARSLLDDARDLRSSDTLFEQRRGTVRAQIAVVDETIARTRTQRDELLDDAGVADVAAFEGMLNGFIERRRALMAEGERMDTRYGELAQRLSQARGESAFAQMKQERAALRCRMAESRRELACLLLARRNLAEAISTWESKSQPEVYRLASRLFEDMTSGAWVQVRLTASGDVQVTSNRGDVRDPQLLSLGTRQQLYLALRIALLMTAQNVGCAVPVLADDILVNFDAERRRCAARALLELACMRQVVLFTCHEEVLNLLRELDAQVNVVEL